MRITPLDVRKQEFRKGMRGLDPEEVYAFLSTVADEYESVLNDNKALRERLLELDDKVQEYRSMEKTLRDTLLTAERVNVEAKENARREANIIIKEAQIEAEKALRDIKTEAMKLRSQVQQLRSHRDAYMARMKVVAESHLGTITAAASDFEREDRALADLDLNEEPVVEKRPVAEPSPSRPTNLFDRGSEADAAPARQREEAPISAPTTPAAPRPEPASQAVPATPTPDSAPAPSPAAAPRTETAAPSAPGNAGPQALGGLATGSVDPISVIIDRMKKGQQEVLSAGAGTPGFVDMADPAPVAGDTAAAPTATAVDSPIDTAGDEADVTSEFNLDEIRRELASEKPGER